MAKFIKFKEANDILRAAPGTEHRVHDLHIFRQLPHAECEAAGIPPEAYKPFPDAEATVISVAQFSPGELAEIQRTGYIYLLFDGVTHPPVSVAAFSPWASVVGLPEEPQK